MRRIIWCTLFLLQWPGLQAQPTAADSLKQERLRAELELLGQRDPAFLFGIDVSAAGLPLAELLRNVAKANEVNLCVRNADQQLVSCNFKNIRVTDLLEFLCREYKLNLEVIGNIVSVYPEAPLPLREPELQIRYERENDLFSCDLTNALLIRVARKIAEQTGRNLIVPQHLYDTRVSAYIHGMPLEEGVNTLAGVNGLIVEKSGEQGWLFTGREEPGTGNRGLPREFSYRPSFAASQLEVDSLGMISAMISSGNLSDIITGVCEKLQLSYYFVTPLQRNISVFVRRVDLPTFLHVLFTGTEYSWYESGGIYLFGTAGKENTGSFLTVRTLPMRYRTVDKVADLIPETLKTGTQVVVFPDQNSLILCGDQSKVTRIEQFLTSIDKSVPLVSIDVIIVDVRKSMIKEAGISMGLGDAPATTGGAFSPGVGVTLGATSINRLINSFNGFGSINLGKVTPNFYMNLKFLEENGNIELRSTPRLSTLNGHEAKLKSGETRYYKEVNTNIIGYQNPMQTDSYVWKSIDANLEVTVVPFVSRDSMITLNITLEQTEFTENNSKVDEKEPAPPGTSTRSFQSILRVRDGEMVLLGGIEKSTKNKTSTGLPFLARVPVIKWLFGSSADNKTSQKLNIFISPTIVF
ncbi:MAG: type II secretion system protein GspD [Culturomica sp.]|nr:type II secretion system protein GspD [Culturomica sp.]